MSAAETLPAGAPSRALTGTLLVLILLVFAGRNLPWHLDDYDQAKQAFVSFEMVQDGQWWFQHTPSGRIATKPPLAGWISAALYGVGRDWEVAWRLPSFLSALVLLALLWRSGHALAGGFTPLFAIAAFALNLTAPRLASLVRTDMMLTLFIFLAGWLTLEKVRTETAWTTRERLALGLAVLASMLTKGPILYAFLLPGLAAFAWIMRRRAIPNRAWAGWLPWFAPLLVFAAWAGLGMWLSRDFYEQVVLREFLGRFDLSDAPVHKHQPVYFYFLQLLRAWSPWSLALLAFLAVRRWRAALVEDRALLWLVCWAVGGFLLMSLVPSKRTDRIFPVIPPLCLLLAVLLQRWISARSELRRRQMAFALVGIAAAVSAGYLVISVIQDSRQNARALVIFGRLVQQASAEHPERLAVVEAKDEGLLLYTGRTRLVDFDDALAAWERGELDWMVVREKHLEEVQSTAGGAIRVLEVPALAGKQSPYYLLRRPAE